jgi:hypothetical protein
LTLRARIQLMLVIALSGLFVGACSVIGIGGGESEPGEAGVESSSEADADSDALVESSADPTPVPYDPNALDENPNRGVYMTSGDDFSAEPDYVEAAQQADLIVFGTVGEPGEPFWTTTSGERPGVTVEGKMPDVPLDQLRWGSSPQIFTPWTLSVGQALKGDVPEDGSILINWWGGEIFPDLFELDGQQAFVTGQELIVYLKDCGPDHLVKYGSQYRYMKRFILSPSGFALLVLETEGVPLSDIRVVIQRELGQAPETELSCE